VDNASGSLLSNKEKNHLREKQAKKEVLKQSIIGHMNWNVAWYLCRALARDSSDEGEMDKCVFEQGAETSSQKNWKIEEDW
jgi:hypothetical protein